MSKRVFLGSERSKGQKDAKAVFVSTPAGGILIMILPVDTSSEA